MDENHKSDQNENRNDYPDQHQITETENNSTKNNKDLYTSVISPITAAFIGLIGGFFLYQVVGGLLTLLVFGMDFEHAPVNGVRLMTMAGQILFILLPALVFSKIFYEDVGKMIRAKIPDAREIGLFTLGIIILTPLLQNYLYIQNHLIEQWSVNFEFVREMKSFFDSMNELVEKSYGNLLSANNVIEGLFVVIVIAVVPAICEEVMFRGFIQKSFEHKIRPFYAALITAVFFGLYHFNPYGLLPLIALGFYFGFAAYMSNSIVVPIVLHFFNNFTAVIMYFLIGNEDLINSAATEDIDLVNSLITFGILLIIFAGVMVMIRRYYSQVRNN